MRTVVDHFMYAVPSLDEGVAWASDVFDATPAPGGAHVGLGTRNALLSLGETYLEIIAPDPAQPLRDTMGERIADLREGGLVSWAAAGSLQAVKAALADMDISCRGPVRTERLASDGTHLVWQLLFPRRHAFGPRLPFFIDWLDCMHPAATNPVGGVLAGLSLACPESQVLNELLTGLGLSVPVRAGSPGMQVDIDTRRGAVRLTCTEDTRTLML